jgi:E2F-associated phosphoprotein
MNQLPHLQEQQQMIVTSCDDTDDCNDDEASAAAGSLNDDDVDNMLTHQKPDDLFFDEDADDEDEAYVYRHLRSGMMETVNILSQPKSDTNSNDGNNNGCSTLASSKGPSKQPNAQKLQVLKPRNTDAVLSCPYCFHIVCMDCQRHTTYKNQYRAMFVMNILVRWDMPLQYSNEHRCLEPYRVRVPERTNIISDVDTEVPLSPRGPSTVASATTTATLNNTSGTNDVDANDANTIYYTVCCANCQTTVAALDMTDEVYHFSGCLASA